ncbi:MAG: sigma-70 family RNA polymerase sigma factor [Nostoc sp. ChiSLP02]|nr:sigma-70 family RNA polymerase sigma factor [Nostoc sp. DedSLP05]MDZ8103229.1 sigma-70 family RNA polymerase sigma factor [Nostoc sp. DedSLP01]MDZ8188020.1 sigma-70 family RNA polymerase sigma factor [Nostoc sp. ChiSLP02]
MSNHKSVVALTTSTLRNTSEDRGKRFWQQWQQYQDALYRCCLKWMGGNSTDAEDALSRAMFKAWEKMQKYAEEIVNFKAWLTRLTHNLCVDIHRERDRHANRVENIEAIPEEQGLVSFDDTPERAMETGEKRIVIRRAIDKLPTRLRETFILHFYQELSYPEIAQQQEISYQNVCKRISQARAILREELRGYFIEEDGTDSNLAVPSAAIGEMSEGDAGIEVIVGETVTLSEEAEEVKIVVGESPQQEALLIQYSGLSLGKIFTLAQFEKETVNCGNFCSALQRMQQQLEVRKGWRKSLLLSHPSPHISFLLHQSCSTLTNAP